MLLLPTNGKIDNSIFQNKEIHNILVEAMKKSEELQALMLDDNLSNFDNRYITDIIKKIKSNSNLYNAIFNYESELRKIWNSIFNKTNLDLFLTVEEKEKCYSMPVTLLTLETLFKTFKEPTNMILKHMYEMFYSCLGTNGKEYVSRNRVKQSMNYINSYKPFYNSCRYENFSTTWAKDDAELSSRGKQFLYYIVVFIEYLKAEKINVDSMSDLKSIVHISQPYLSIETIEELIEPYLEYKCFKKGSLKIKFKNKSDVDLINKALNVKFANTLY